MRYLMKQKFFSFSDSFRIKNENGDDVFTVEGQIFSWGKKLSFMDMAGNEILFLKQRLMVWSPTYEIYKGERLYATIKKEPFTFFNCRFNIDMADSDSIEIDGDILDHEYTFTRDGRVIARVSKQWFTWTDAYGIDVIDEENAAFILACAVIIDMICHENNE